MRRFRNFSHANRSCDSLGNFSYEFTDVKFHRCSKLPNSQTFFEYSELKGMKNLAIENRVLIVKFFIALRSQVSKNGLEIWQFYCSYLLKYYQMNRNMIRIYYTLLKTKAN